MAVNSSMEDEYQREVLKKNTLLRLLKYLLVYKKQIIIVLAVMLVTIAVSIVNPLLIERAINIEIPNKDVKGLLTLSILAIVLNILCVIGIKIRMFMMARISNHVLLDIRNELYEHIQTLSFSFFDSRPTGKILARIIGDVNSLKDVLSDSVTKLIPDFLTVIAVIAIMVVKNWKLAMAALILLPFLIAGMCLVQNLSHRRWQIFRKKNSNITAFIHENFQGIRVVQSFTAEEESLGEFDSLLEQHRKSFCDAVRLADGYGALIELTWGIGSFLLYFIGVRILGVGNVGVGTFVAFSSYLSMFWGPIRNLSNFYNKLVTNLSAAERIFDILDTEPEVADREPVKSLLPIEGRVRFDHVSFSYSDEPDTMVLNDVSFDIAPGETIALVGPTGAGKTTIVNLISRFYNITKGRVLVDDMSVEDVSINSLRKQMGVMTQDNYLFSGTIKENIRYGRLDATDEEIVAAARAVNAHAFIMEMEDGYDTQISERGVRLSIGQRQLLAFARTMVSDPRILILDEATSSIDTHTEILVQQGIESLLAGRTSFVIAHRLSTIKNADRIFVIDDGRIVEAGNHGELMEKKGAYYQLYEAQFKNIA